MAGTARKELEEEPASSPPDRGARARGYLTPDEVRHLAGCLQDQQPPDRAIAEADYASFRQEQSQPVKEFRMIDEVLPAHADSLMDAVRIAVQHGLGLICSAE